MNDTGDMHPRIARDTLSLAIIQAANALIPLIVFPYVLSVIGPAAFAPIALVEALALVVLAASLYSFDISGLRMVVDASESARLEEGKVYYSILLARLIIFALVSLGVLVVATIFFFDYVPLVLIWLGLPLSACLQSSYHYLARRRNAVLAVFVLLPRLASCVLVLLFVSEGASSVAISLYIVGGYVASGVASLVYLAANLGPVSAADIGRKPLRLIREGRPLFVASVSVILYRGSNTLLLGAMSAGPVAISYYAVAEKFVRMLQAVFFPLSQAYSVRVLAKLAGGAAVNPKGLIWAATRRQVLLALIAIPLSLIGAMILRHFEKDLVPAGVLETFAIMVLAIPFGIASYMFGTIGLGAVGRERLYAALVLATGVSAVVVSVLLIPVLSNFGAAIAYLVAEVLLCLLVVGRVGRPT